MNRMIFIGLTSVFLLGVGCSSSDTGNGTGGAGGATGGTGGATGGTGGATGGTGGATGGTGGATGGTGGATGGTGGATGGTGGATGGTGGATGGTGGATGGAGGAPTFWPKAYNAQCVPKVTKGHNQGTDCLLCHTGGSAPKWLFGGTVWKTGGTTGAAHVEIGVKAGSKFYYACTESNGNFHYAATSTPGGPITWSATDARMRDANGEATMPMAPASGACNKCHTGTSKLIAP